ncbi:dihydroorotate dehydrogenase electron transfer subunit [Chlorobium sp. N1]|uniref:dihydroorotate dehydrogenase electron transfer subunit n=1 Tax=Chlorobium sp. N1 TaxID=2491138 RepID=UPI00103A2E51|nr:dihydroorotate dehydrogenase electron transfer subunit [Chlorobium sp. N1]TCD47841.1 dihydroorotate dehydrogenase electron transfer subunit [Chlorobium sp. N1]
MQRESTITDTRATLTDTRRISRDVSIITLRCPEVAEAAEPGNFVNVRVSDTTQPLLRRPFSIHDAEGDEIRLMVKEIGKGTEIFCGCRPGTELSILGPLGNRFSVEADDYDTALLVSGGIGTAPMKLLERRLRAKGKTIVNLIGGRTKTDLLQDGLSDCRLATDDGSEGLHATVLALLAQELPALCAAGRPRVFACGPTPMLKAVAAFSREQKIPSEVSLESVMGCGFGICYGCSVEVAAPEGGTKTVLLCREGPVIDGGRMV